jgi:XTP/dITP diphosphohydrolase
VVAVVDPDGREATVEGRARGRILTGPRGTAGFGYDPVFWVPASAKTVAEMTLQEKRRVSHRGRALRDVRRLLQQWYGLA